MRPQRRPAPRAVPVVDRSGQRVPRPRAEDAPGATPSRRMTVVNGTPASHEMQEEARFKTLSRQQQIEAAITAHVEYVRRQNSPEVLEKLSETEFWRYVFEHSIRNAQLMDTGTDLRIVLHAASLKEIHAAWLACQKLAPASTSVVTRPRMPNNDPWWAFIRDIRKGSGA